MAVEFSDDVVVPQSTGAVKSPTDPVVVVQDPGAAVTNAVDAPDPVVTTEFGDLGQESTKSFPNPEPQKFENVSVKVVNAPKQQHPSGDSTAETDTRRTRRQDIAEGGGN